MRITNNMIMSNTKININGNKTSLDTLNNQMSSQKKISSPADDPVVAIRALRLRSNLSQINQYYEKNIPDAESWLEVTETALTNMKKILTTIHTKCDEGANGTLTEEDRNTILKQLKSLSSQIYSEGNADYAGRTVFTGYKTDKTLTFENDMKDAHYDIYEYLNASDIEEFTYTYGAVKTPTAADVAAQTAPGKPEDVTLYRLCLAYDKIDGLRGEGPDATNPSRELAWYSSNGNGKVQFSTVTTKELEDSQYAIGDSEVVFNKDTGEFLMGKTIASTLSSCNAVIPVNYEKTGFEKGEIRPEHYFDCYDYTDPLNQIKYTNYENGALAENVDYESAVRTNQDIEYIVAANQTLTVNTQANDVFDSSIARDVDDLIFAVQNSINAHDTVTAIEDMLKQERYASKEDQQYLNSCLEAAKKQMDYADNNLQNLFSRSLTKFSGYMADVNIAITDVGNKAEQLAITKNRMSNQQATVESLKSDNEDRDLSDIVIDYTSSYLAYQASLQAAAKIERQTLLDYL
ncbi:MAG: flagellar hook-associated protein FlgL [Lachnospiraceae bacterium]|nr:flagellar hook-associated protein FlgL [Lachnospiraceae bacterium]